MKIRTGNLRKRYKNLINQILWTLSGFGIRSCSMIAESLNLSLIAETPFQAHGELSIIHFYIILATESIAIPICNASKAPQSLPKHDSQLSIFMLSRQRMLMKTYHMQNMNRKHLSSLDVFLCIYIYIWVRLLQNKYIHSQVSSLPMLISGVTK